MSISTGGGYPAGYPAASVPAARVNFGWITESWQLFMAQTGVWIVATVALVGPPVVLGVGFYIYFLVSLFPHGFSPPVPTPGVPAAPPVMPPMFAGGNIGKIVALEVAVGLIFAVYSAFLYGGMFRMAVRQLRGLPPTYKDIFAGGPLFGRMLGAMFLLGFGAYGLEAVCVGPGYAMLFLHANTVGAVIALVLGFLLVFCIWPVLMGLLLPSFALMADGVPVFPALRRSIQAMKGNWLGAAGFVLVLGLLVYASELPCFLGLLATVPMIFLTCALAYRDMAGMTGIPPPPAPSYPPAAPGVWPPPPGQSPYGQSPQAGGWPPPQ